MGYQYDDVEKIVNLDQALAKDLIYHIDCE